MKTKDSSVNLTDLHPKMWVMLPVLSRWWEQAAGYPLTITSACDGKHTAEFSRHYSGCAVDIRTWTTETSGKQLSRTKRTILRNDLQAMLDVKFGPHFQVLNESTHFHIAYKPREAVTWATLV